jgi:uncharacterized protein DUF4123
MRPSPKLNRLYEALWSEDEKLFAVLDGARDSRVFGAVDASHEDKHCLYSGERHWPGNDISWDLIGVAPYLVELEKGDDLTHFVLRNGWNHDWGIFCHSEAGIATLRAHFRSLLIVRNEQNRKMMFRYYDPRVLRAYLPTCTPAELKAVFGPVTTFVIAGDDPATAIQYSIEGSTLRQNEVNLLETVPA